jgi:uncharacterized membrane protein YebE (DUF533 family)
MLNAKSLLDGLLGGQTASGLGERAKEAWNSQSTLGKGAIAGGLLGILLTQGGRRMLGTGLKVGGMAAIGGLAYKAYEDWKAGRSDDPAGPAALPSPAGTAFEPADADAFAHSLLLAMISAAKADGRVSPEERTRIDGQLANLGLQDEAAALIAAELDAPLDVGKIAAMANTEAEAMQIYAISLLAVDPDGAAEKGYLAMLAARLNLDQALVERLHSQAAHLQQA